MAEIKKIKPSLPKGTRDFLPEEVARRNYIFDTIKSILRKYGFQQIETPAVESLETLKGKYGDEGDKLLFKIRSNKNLRDRFTPELNDLITNEYPFKFIPRGSEKALRYDLTVPFARYVVQHQNDLVFPFRRFHIGPVWRGDRPQKGRYQEFYQCDADVIGSTSLINEIELTQIYLEVFEKLGMNVTVRINHRRLIDEILSKVGVIDDNKTKVITLLDKLDKVEWSGGNGIGIQLLSTGMSVKEVDDLFGFLFTISYFNFKDQFDPKTAADIDFVLSKFQNTNSVFFDTTIMRGLDYYTGIVWEVVLSKYALENENIKMGSLGGGGRYDNLTEMFGGRDMSGVGISFGIERIYDVMEELGLFPAALGETTKVLFVHFDEMSEAYAFEALQKVRAADIASEIYPGKKKLDKQMNYANDKKIPYVVVVGGDEMASGKLTFKNMASGDQEKLTIEEIIERLK